MRMKCGNPPIVVETSGRRFIRFWQDFIIFISTILETFADERVASAHNVLIYRLPPVATVPYPNFFVTYVKKPKNLDDVFLSFNVAYASMAFRTYFYLVPYVDPNYVSKVVEAGANPAILVDTMYALPIIASIPATTLLKGLGFIRDLLMLKAYAYLLSDDLAQNILGYLLLKLVRSKPKEYQKVMEASINFVRDALFARGLKHKMQEKEVSRYGTTIRIIVLMIRG